VTTFMHAVPSFDRRRAPRAVPAAARDADRPADGEPEAAGDPGRLSADLHVGRVDGPGEVVLRFRGELDLAADGTVRAVLEQALRHHPRRLVIDLREVTFMDSTGTRILLATQARAEAHGWALVVRPGAVVARVFELSGIARRFRSEA
jgi:anti-anti-sigma factor